MDQERRVRTAASERSVKIDNRYPDMVGGQDYRWKAIEPLLVHGHTDRTLPFGENRNLKKTRTVESKIPSLAVAAMVRRAGRVWPVML